MRLINLKLIIIYLRSIVLEYLQIKWFDKSPIIRRKVSFRGRQIATYVSKTKETQLVCPGRLIKKFVASTLVQREGVEAMQTPI